MADETVTIRLFGVLHTARKEKGLPDVVTVAVPPEGRPAEGIARELDLPLDKIEAVFVNHRTYDLGHVIRPGDAVAFVPQGTPGPHRFTLGIHEAGRKASPSGQAAS
jgi:hypothetical protein